MHRTIHGIVTSFMAGLVLLGAGGMASAGYYAARNGTNSDQSPYTSWATAASNIHDAVVAATNNATVWVGAGRYTCPTNGVLYEGITNVVYINKPLTLRGASGNPADVIIDGLGTNRGVQVYYNSNTSDLFVMNGLTVSNSYDHGIHFRASTKTWTGVVQRCVITHGASGAGVYNKDYNSPRTIIVSDSLIRNSPDQGLMNYSTLNSPQSLITDTTIENSEGGGLSFHNGTHILERCIVRSNNSPASSGGLSMGAGTYYLYNCLIYNNSAVGIGGAIYKWSATGPLYIHNCTIVSNKSTSIGPGGVRSQAVNPICNSIVRFNYLNTGIDDWYAYGGTTFTNSNSTGTMPGANNISTDPKFVDLGGFDFRLSQDSPCINTGTNLPWMAGAADLDGFRRVDAVNNRVDMGCYEYAFQGSLILVR